MKRIFANPSYYNQGKTKITIKEKKIMSMEIKKLFTHSTLLKRKFQAD